jgi:hypothetical protein
MQTESVFLSIWKKHAKYGKMRHLKETKNRIKTLGGLMEAVEKKVVAVAM